MNTTDTARIERLLVAEQENHRYLTIFLDRIQQTPPHELQPGDRSRLLNFDRTAIRKCNAELCRLESVEKHTSEQKRLVKQLDKLIGELDVVVGRALVLRDEKVGPAEGKDEGDSVQYAAETDVETVAEDMSTTELGEGKEAAEAPGFEWEDAGRRGDDPVGFDPLGMYAELGLAMDAALPVIQKAIKCRLVVLHPDRHPNDSDGAHHRRYVDFTEKARIFGKEKSRAAYDAVETRDDLDEVRQRYM